MSKKNGILAMAAMICLYISGSHEIKAQTREWNDSTVVSWTNSTDAGAALQGRFSGLLVINPSGAPGETARLQVRGFIGADNDGPALIVDGLKVDNIQHLDPSMIEKVEVLKDAAATALYGIHGGNGVILITTRKGEGKFSVGYDFRITSSSLGLKADILNSEEWLKRNNISGYDGTGTDWQDVVYGNGLAHQHSLTLQEGNEKGGFFAAVNYLDNDGIVTGSADKHNRLAARLNGKYQLTDWLEVGISSSFTTQKIGYIHQQQKWFSMFAETLTHDPVTEPYFSDPSEFPGGMFMQYANGMNILKDPTNDLYYAVSRFTDSINPLIYRDTQQAYAGYEDINAIAYARFSPVNGLAVTGRFGYKSEGRDKSGKSVPYYATDQWRSDYYSLSITENSRSGYQADLIAEYNIIKARHTVSTKAGLYYENSTIATRSGSERYATTAVSYDDISFTATELNYSDLGAYALMGYDFDKRYIIQASFRADSYKCESLPSNEKLWSLFPTLSLGWRVSNESFFTDNICRNAVSLLALKASWGKGGNPDGYGRIMTTDQLNIGIATAFFKNRLNISADWYEKVTDNISVNSTGSDPGTSLLYPIMASVRNTGLDIDMSWNDRAGEFAYRISGTLSTLKNEVSSLGDGNIIRVLGESYSGGVNTAYESGKSVWHFYGYPADVSYDDMSTLEKTYIGKGIPSIYYGTEISLAYNGFDLNITGYGTSGNDIANCIFGPNLANKNIIREYLGNEWKENGTLKLQSAATVFEGSFFRIKQLQIGYTIPAHLTRKIYVQNARIFASLDDWFTFSTYPGGDPETATTGSMLSGMENRPGMDYGSYPMARKIVFGVSIRF